MNLFNKPVEVMRMLVWARLGARRGEGGFVQRIGDVMLIDDLRSTAQRESSTPDQPVLGSAVLSEARIRGKEKVARELLRIAFGADFESQPIPEAVFSDVLKGLSDELGVGTHQTVPSAVTYDVDEWQDLPLTRDSLDATLRRIAGAGKSDAVNAERVRETLRMALDQIGGAPETGHPPTGTNLTPPDSPTL